MTEIDLPIINPARYVSPVAVSFGSAGAPAVPCSEQTPLPVADRSFSSARSVLPDQFLAAGRALAVSCVGSGEIKIKLAEGSTISVPVEEGFSILPFVCTGFAAAGTTANASCWILD